MSDEAPQPAPVKPRRPLPAILRYVGVVVLVVGIAGAALIYLFAADDAGTDPAAEITAGRMYEHNVELMGGKFALYSIRLNEWLASLWQGKSLAGTVAVLAIAIALACFWIAHLASVPPSNEPDDTRRD